MIEVRGLEVGDRIEVCHQGAWIRGAVSKAELSNGVLGLEVRADNGESYLYVGTGSFGVRLAGTPNGVLPT